MVGGQSGGGGARVADTVRAEYTDAEAVSRGDRRAVGMSKQGEVINERRGVK